MTHGHGAAWAHGGLPPWMQQPPGFDESDAADAADLLAERFGPTGGQATDRPDLLAERFGPVDDLSAPARPDSPDASAVCGRRRAALEGALRPPLHPPTSGHQAAA